MSQENVERVIGQLVTDESFRRRFAADTQRAVQRLVESGVTLSDCERRALESLDIHRFDEFAQTLHPCISKVDLKGEFTCEN